MCPERLSCPENDPSQITRVRTPTVGRKPTLCIRFSLNARTSTLNFFIFDQLTFFRRLDGSHRRLRYQISMSAPVS